MLISRLPEEGAGEGRDIQREDNSHEYQTASELFEIIAKNHTFNQCNDALSNSDLVILYKNLELGTKLMSDTPEGKPSPRCNQRVETIVHQAGDAESDSEADDALSAHDLAPADVFLINKERLDLLNNPPSLENTLCHKFGELEIKMSHLGTDVLFKTATVKEKLDNLKLMSSSNDLHDPVLPSSLLDYICCKRLEDNYTFYMDSIIRYVKHTIDQLKRISNGDYLTDKVREKWREISEDTANAESNKKILAASTSIPLHVERKRTGRTITWDDIVHSEMDIRYLSKILEKKIFLEVPKIITGSYQLFSKQCADNLIISCEKARERADKESRMDVVLKLRRSETGHVISNINSIMILQAAPVVTHGPIIALPVSENEETTLNEQRIVELNNETDERNEEFSNEEPQNDDGETKEDEDDDYQEAVDDNVLPTDTYKRAGNYYQEAAFVSSPDQLSLSMQRLDIQSSLPEESAEEFPECIVPKKKSPTRLRIKSPYENKSHLIDEKKRKKLLEIRERREKKKMALSEGCKVMKHRHAKGTLMPQASSSVTKLSITNKSFYNSIYGQTAAADNKQKIKVRKGRKETDTNMSGQEYLGEMDVSLPSPVEKSKPHLNKNHYLDDAETEMMLYMQAKGHALSPSTSSAVDSTELVTDLSLLSQQLVPSIADFVEKSSTSPEPKHSPDNSVPSPSKSFSPCRFEENFMEHLVTKKSDHDVVPFNSPNKDVDEDKHETEVVSTVECRKSIEKLYGLLKNIGKPISGERSSKCSLPPSFTADITTFRDSSTIQVSDSGTSLKHHMTCSETSSFTSNKPAVNNAATMYETTPQTTHRATSVTANVVPKVIISTKCQAAKAELEKPKKDHKRVAFSAPKVIPENPLKAISQLLHEFDNVQKVRHKSSEERPVKPKKEVAGDRSARHSPQKGRSRLDQHLKNVDPSKNIIITVPREKKQNVVTEPRSVIHESKDKYDKYSKRKISEIIDEVKEARGEAVRGPSKNSRLNTLAQPKKSYVQAHSEEYQSRYGRNLMADRLQRLAAPASADRHASGADKHAAPGAERHAPPGAERHVAAAQRARPRRPEPAPAAPGKVQAPPPIESTGRVRRSASTSPASKRGPDGRRGADAAPKQCHVQHVPDNIREKMVAVESYVKSHYGRAGSPHSSGRVAKKSRVPLLPSDIELSITSSPPCEESTTIGTELHNLIDSMMKNTPALDALTEALEESKSSDQERVEENLTINEDILVHFNSDVFKDNIQTAVEEYQDKSDSIVLESTEIKHDLRKFSSSTEMLRLDNALFKQMSIGSFQKRLRINKLTITPKHSMQLLVGVQSGDVGSVMMKTSVSQNFEVTNCSFTSKISDLKKTMPILTNPSDDWRHSPVPMQVSTVGYAFPKYQTFGTDSKLKDLITSLINTNGDEERMLTNDKEKTKSIKTCSTTNYSCQTFEGRPSYFALECSNAVDTKVTSCGNKNPEIFEKAPPFSDDQPVVLEKHSCTENELRETNTDILSTENKENNIANIEKATQDDIEYTTSLDMLVGLLNEIQKITQMQVSNLTNNNIECSQLDTILNNAATLEKNVIDSNGIITLTALDTSRMLDSSPSSYSFYLNKSDRDLTEQHTSNVEQLHGDVLLKEKPAFVDKEVNAIVPDKEYKNTCTDVPSGFFPIPVNTSTSVTNSLIVSLNARSTPSMFSCLDGLYLETVHDTQKVLELNADGDDISDIKLIPEKNEKVVTKIDMMDVAPTLPEVEEVKTLKVTKKSKQLTKMRWSKSNSNKEFDPLLKMKRDILVTLYSVLVLTVFAALSFPEVLYRA